jgi:peroxiredoxin Q/BCP
MPPTEEIRAGDQALSHLGLPDHTGAIRRLDDFRGRNLVVYFYPRDDTPGCTVEGQEFRDLLDQFAALDCEVIGVSVDSVQSHRAFREKHSLGFTLLSDSDGKLTRAFGVMREGYAARSTFVLDRELRIRRSFSEVTPRGHAQQVLNFVRTLLESHRMLGG